MLPPALAAVGWEFPSEYAESASDDDKDESSESVGSSPVRSITSWDLWRGGFSSVKN